MTVQIRQEYTSEITPYIRTPSGVSLGTSVPSGNNSVQNTEVFRTDPGDYVPLNREASLPETHGEF